MIKKINYFFLIFQNNFIHFMIITKLWANINENKHIQHGKSLTVKIKKKLNYTFLKLN